jgi:NhaP-type Na+/H+ or K+/H+ antiporter
MSSDMVFLGLGLLLALAVGCQVLAHRLRLPAIVLLLPAGFAAGQWTESVNPDALFGDSFAPMVGLAVAVILFEGGLNLRVRDLEGHSQRVVRRLVFWGVVITWLASALLTYLLFPMSAAAAALLGAILIVSGPTVVAPLLRVVEPGRRLTAILEWESTTVDPIGAILATFTYQVVHTGAWYRPGRDFLILASSVGIGLLGGLVGLVVLWLLLERLSISGVLATESTIAVVVVVAAVCNAIRDDTGLIAAIAMGVAITNTGFLRSPEDRPFFRTIVELMIGLLFISISATVTAASVQEVLWPALALTAILILVVRPLVTVAATKGTDLTRSERSFIALMGPRGIVAASTAATLALPLLDDGVEGAHLLMPVTFLVIVGTVTVAGLLARPAKRWLHLDAVGLDPGPDEPAAPPPTLGV